MSYLGIDKSSTVLIKNSETGVVVEGNIKYSSNESPGKEMSTGNTFKLPASKWHYQNILGEIYNE